MPGTKTNERAGTRAVLRHARLSAYKVREVLDLVRGRPVHEAEDILRFSERDAASVVAKVLHSAVANAENNDELDPEELYVSACFADEGTTIKRWRPRARGRATRIRKRSCHITVIVSRLPDERLERLRAHRRAEQLAQRARRVAGARRAEGDTRNRADRRRGVQIEDEAAEVTEEATEATTGAGTTEASETASETAAASSDAGDASATDAPDAASDEAATASEDVESPGGIVSATGGEAGAGPGDASAEVAAEPPPAGERERDEGEKA
jgi:large subunit ribosomal protein L22